MFNPLTSRSADDLRRLSCQSSDWQTLHLQPIMGTPCDVPVPKNVSFIYCYSCFIRDANLMFFICCCEKEFCHVSFIGFGRYFSKFALNKYEYMLKLTVNGAKEEWSIVFVSYVLLFFSAFFYQYMP